MKWTLLYRQKFIRPLWYINYSKEEAKKILNKKTGWQYYEGHHLENRSSMFSHTIWLPRYGTDFRYLALAANVRNKKIERFKALKEMKKPIVESKMLINYLKKRLKLSDLEYKKILSGKKRTWKEFKSYKRRFELLKPIFYIFMKLNLVPVTFYQNTVIKLIKMITILNYGLGNLGSIQNMLHFLEVESKITSDINIIKNASKIILPGVGAFDTAIQKLRSINGLLDILNHKALIEKVPVLGICLGMQILTRNSEEGVLKGLNWIPGKSS